MSGRPRSRIIRSGGCSATWLMAVAPLMAVLTEYPRLLSTRTSDAQQRWFVVDGEDVDHASAWAGSGFRASEPVAASGGSGHGGQRHDRGETAAGCVLQGDGAPHRLR